MRIDIEWQGPLSIEDIANLHESSDFGIYQLYGRHTVYGEKTLLYIGKAWLQTFGTRISQHYLADFVCGTAAAYVGRLGYFPPRSDNWEQRVSLAEKLLIYAHAPAWNTQNINDYDPIDNLRIFNWGDYGLLLPEVSHARYQYSHNHLPDNRIIYTDE